MSKASEFLSQEIKVNLSGRLGIPVSFRMEDRKYEILDIVDAWQDYGFGRASLKRKRWWQRHHRSYYRVKTAKGEEYEIYHDRGTGLEQVRKGKWFVSRRILPSEPLP